MPDRHRTDAMTHIDLADRLDAALDSDAPGAADMAGLLALPAADPIVKFLSLAAEIREVLHRPVLSDADRVRIHGRALDIVATGGGARLRRGWPQLAQRAAHPAVLGGAAAAALAVVGVAALQWRSRGGPAALQPA